MIDTQTAIAVLKVDKARPPVVFGLSRILVTAPRLCLQVADYPVDRIGD